MYEILYSKTLKYPKIVAIKPIGFEWGVGELDTDKFGIVKLDMTDKQIADTYNQNAWMLNSFDTPTELDITDLNDRPLPQSHEAIAKQKAWEASQKIIANRIAEMENK